MFVRQSGDAGIKLRSRDANEPSGGYTEERPSAKAASALRISVLVLAYRRPHQLREALASLAAQDRSLIGEILIGDDSPAEEAAANQAEIAASELAPLVQYFHHTPRLGAYPNHWFLGDHASYPHLLFLHDDDRLCAGALSALAQACISETDDRVCLWFGRNLYMDVNGVVDPELSMQSNEWFGRKGESAARPMWEWCLNEAVPPNSFLVKAADYRQWMRHPRDGNVGDWGFVVRLANSGAWARFLAQDLSFYRVQAGSSTSAGRGIDVHRAYEIAQQLQVPPTAEHLKRKRFGARATVAAVRYARDGERLNAWKCYCSPNWSWRQRLSVRGLAVLAMILTPSIAWSWALRYRD